MSFDLFEIACRTRGEARVLASRHVSRYGPDALALARIARADVTERGRVDRATLYDAVIALLEAARDHAPATAMSRAFMQMTINDHTVVNKQRVGSHRRQVLMMAG